MPQLSQIGEIYASQLFWLAIVFALIYFGIGKAMVPKIERTMDDRAARISGDLAAAEAARRSAADAEAGYQGGLETARSQAQRTLADVQARAAAGTEAQTRQSDEALATRIAEATARLDQTKSQALVDIEAATVEAVQAIVAKLSGASVDHAMAEQQVKAELAHG